MIAYLNILPRIYTKIKYIFSFFISFLQSICVSVSSDIKIRNKTGNTGKVNKSENSRKTSPENGLVCNTK